MQVSSLICVLLLCVGGCSISHAFPSRFENFLRRVRRADGTDSEIRAKAIDPRDGLIPAIPSNSLSSGAAEAAGGASSGASNLIPIKPFGSSQSGSSGGLITEPLAILGGFSMLVMPMSGLKDVASMMSSFQQLTSGMGSLPTMPPLPTLPTLPTMPSLPTMVTLPSLPTLPTIGA